MNAALRHDPLPAAEDHAALERAAALVAEADALVIAAGAGMGVDSGLPDFRGNAGFRKAYPALAAEGTIHRLQCLGPCSPRLWPAAGFVPAVDGDRCELLGAQGA